MGDLHRIYPLTTYDLRFSIFYVWSASPCTAQAFTVMVWMEWRKKKREKKEIVKRNTAAKAIYFLFVISNI